MLSKETVLEKIYTKGIVAVVRADNKDDAFKIVEACLEGGVNAVEITFTVPGAHSIIESLQQNYHDELIIGAGTVLDSETARIAILSGAKFIVFPYFEKELMKLCNRYRIATMPGAMTIKDIIEAMEYGADIIKLFPGELGGPRMIKAIKGPIPQVKIMPTGGVDINNIDEWIKSGAVAVGTGSSLVGPAKTGDYSQITKRAKAFVEKIQTTRKAMEERL